MMLSSRAQLPDEAELTWDAGDAHRSRCWITCRDIADGEEHGGYVLDGWIRRSGRRLRDGGGGR